MLNLILKFLFLPVKFFPRRLEMFLGYILGVFLYLLRFRRKIVRKNLLHAYEDELKEGIKSLKDIKRIEFNNYIHYGRLVFEFFHLPFDAKNFAKKNVRVHGYEHIENALKKGGVFFLSAHVGYWEIMGIVATLYKLPLNVLTKFLRIKILDDIWVRSREQCGIKLIDERFSAINVFKKIQKKEIVGIVLDQHGGLPIGIKVDFFKKPAWTIASFAWLVGKTKGSVIPVTNYRRSDGTFDLYVYPELEFKEFEDKDETIRYNTQLYTNIIEDFIRKCPEQWLWIHRRWKKTVEGL